MRGQRFYTFEGYNPADGLTGGQWVRRGYIYVWQRVAGTAQPQFCGTERGYQWHRYHQPDNWPLPAEDPCGCRAAHAAWRCFQDRIQRREESAA